jgi:hypothetical protein
VAVSTPSPCFTAAQNNRFYRAVQSIIMGYPPAAVNPAPNGLGHSQISIDMQPEAAERLERVLGG